MDRSAYQWDYWRTRETVRDEKRGFSKGRKVRSVLEDSGTICPRADLRVLDIGCSTGAILAFILSSWPGVTGIGLDIDREALRLARQKDTGQRLILGDAMRLPFKDCTFDVIICSQVYEHVPDWSLMLDEIYRILRPNGVCFFSGPNKWWIIEGHYRLPFLSWLPRTAAHLYIRLFGKNSVYYEKPVSWFTLLRKFRSTGFDVMDYTWKILENPAQFGFRGVFWDFLGLITRGVPQRWRPLLTWVSPNFNVVLIKRGTRVAAGTT